MKRTFAITALCMLLVATVSTTAASAYTMTMPAYAFGIKTDTGTNAGTIVINTVYKTYTVVGYGLKPGTTYYLYYTTATGRHDVGTVVSNQVGIATMKGSWTNLVADLTTRPTFTLSTTPPVPLPPTLIRPVDGATFEAAVSKGVVFEWSAVAGATGYEVIFEKKVEGTWTRQTGVWSHAPTTFFTPTIDFTPGEWRWFASASSDNPTYWKTAYSAPRYFTVTSVVVTGDVYLTYGSYVQDKVGTATFNTANGAWSVKTTTSIFSPEYAFAVSDAAPDNNLFSQSALIHFVTTDSNGLIDQSGTVDAQSAPLATINQYISNGGVFLLSPPQG